MTDKITTFEKDLNTYLDAKLPDIPADVKLDVSAFIANRTGNLLLDMIMDRDAYWRKEFDRVREHECSKLTKREFMDRLKELTETEPKEDTNV